MKYFEILKNCNLFNGITEYEADILLKCIMPAIKKYGKNEILFYSGQKITSLALVLKGKVQLFSDDIFGNRSIISDIFPSGLFAEAVPFTKSQLLPVSAFAVADCEIMLFDKERLLSTCGKCCGFHNKILENLITAISEKNIILNKKTEHISKRSIREKVLSYLNEYKIISGKDEFSIPFNRQQLADYLCVDRSALSFQLCKLKEEKILDFNKNRFKIFI